MLGKLIKYEFKATSKILAILHIALFITTIMGIIAISISKKNNLEYISNLTMVLYVLILIAVAVAALIYMVVRFYRNIFTDEGYLMNTLPVKSYELILSKLIVSFVWTLINAVCTIFSISLLALSNTSVSTLSSGWNEVTVEVLNELGITLGNLLLFCCIGGLISILYMFLMFYASISIGQTMQNHKVLFSLGSYVILYIVSQIVTTIGLIPFGFISLMQSETENLSTSLLSIFIPSYLLSIVLMIGYFIITNYIIRKKLNLE